ncbi:MAG: hypothetical protein CMJ87_01030 [Planctomycetes bacterium]|jgi:hypothetical protein|nr:hypothetical protein [Planctomycetota bacterium]
MAWALVLAADHFWPPAPDQHATLRWARVAAAHPLRLFFGFYLLLWAAFPQRPARASTEPSSEGHQQPPRT